MHWSSNDPSFSSAAADWSHVEYKDEDEAARYMSPCLVEWRSTVSPSLHFTLRLHTLRKLWADRIWPASTHLAEVFADPTFVCHGLQALELGAGPGLPSLVLASRGAQLVMVTDFPDQHMLDNIRWNLKHNVGPETGKDKVVQGHLWGDDPTKLLQHTKGNGFDVIIMSDLLYELDHEELLSTCQQCLRENGQVYVSFQLHDASQARRNLAFFDMASCPPYHFKHRQVLCVACPDPLSEDYGLGENEISDYVHIYIMERQCER